MCIVWPYLWIRFLHICPISLFSHPPSRLTSFCRTLIFVEHRPPPPVPEGQSSLICAWCGTNSKNQLDILLKINQANIQRHCSTFVRLNIKIHPSPKCAHQWSWCFSSLYRRFVSLALSLVPSQSSLTTTISIHHQTCPPIQITHTSIQTSAPSTGSPRHINKPIMATLTKGSIHWPWFQTQGYGTGKIETVPSQLAL